MHAEHSAEFPELGSSVPPSLWLFCFLAQPQTSEVQIKARGKNYRMNGLVHIISEGQFWSALGQNGASL